MDGVNDSQFSMHCKSSRHLEPAKIAERLAPLARSHPEVSQNLDHRLPKLISYSRECGPSSKIADVRTEQLTHVKIEWRRWIWDHLVWFRIISSSSFMT